MGETLGGKLLHGTVDLLILRVLADGPRHGFGISRILRDRSDGTVELQDAALYQALHRMARKGWVRAEWGVSDSNRRAKFYSLSPRGRSQLAREEKQFRALVEGVMGILKPRVSEP